MAKSFGASRDPDKLAQMALAAEEYVLNPAGQMPLFSILTKEDLTIQNFLEGLSNFQIHTIGPELIFGNLFDRIGFNELPDKLFRHITIARLAYPSSKLKTVDYLYRYRGIKISDEKVYRFLDKLNSEYKTQVETIAYQHSLKLLGGNITVVFYDMTTLYFEAEDEDDLRKIGYSKDGKFQQPQIMLGLLVGKGGLPIGYDIFEGNKFEGHTLLPILAKIQSKYHFGKPVVVADAGLLSNDNLEELAAADYKYILGARVKNETDEVKKQILELASVKTDGDSFIIKKDKGVKLIVTYSEKRAKKDFHNREKGLKKLRVAVKSGKLTKEQIHNRGYNKFLNLTGSVTIDIDEDKIMADEKWDGLKGYVTNTRLKPKDIVEHYGHLWQIEKAFRISKTDLRIRPVYHRLRKRIEAHICIAFVAYSIFKELERLLQKHQAGFSPHRAAELTHNMYEVEYTLPQSRQQRLTLLKMDFQQNRLYEIIRKN